MTTKAIKEGNAYTTVTRVVPVNAIAYCSSSPTLYFHPDSETIIALDKCDGDRLEQEHNRLALLLAARVDAQQRIETLTAEAAEIGWGGLTARERYQYLLTQEYQQLDEAVTALRDELSDLTPVSALPQAKLLDENAKQNAIGIIELIEIRGGEYRGGKVTYVRSDKIQSHWRRYRLNEGERKAGHHSFITTVSHTDEEGLTRTRQTVDMTKLKTRLAKIKPSMTLWEQTLLDHHIEVLARWAEALNESLEKHAESGNGNIVLDSQAQLLRWTYGAGLNGCLNPFEYDIRKRQKKTTATVSGKLSAYASLALAEAKSMAKVYWPDHAGVRICYPLDPERIPGGGMGVLGTLRFDFELALSGSIGASLGIEAGVHFSGDTVKGLPVKAVPTGIPGYWRQVDISKAAEDVKAGAELNLFAGAEAGGNLGGKLVWLNPEKDGHGSEQFSTLARVATDTMAQTGWGISGCVELSWKDGKVRIRVRGGLCSGVGAKGSVTLEVDGRAIMSEFMPCLIYMLRNADYTRLMAIMTENDYNYFCAIPLLVGMYGLNRVIDGGEDIIDTLSKGWDDKERRVRLMNEILSSDDCMKFTPPESKGAVIASLIETSFWDELASPASHREKKCEGGTLFARRKRAILNVLRWVQSKREYDNIMQHLSATIGEKGDGKANESRVLAFLGRGEAPREYGYDGRFIPGAQKVIITPGHYAENLQAIYDWLPDAPAVPAGHPNMSEGALMEVPLRYIHSCTNLITTQHGR